MDLPTAFNNILTKLNDFLEFNLTLRSHSRNECVVRLLEDVKHQDHYFDLLNGVKLRSLCELADGLNVMDDETFASHVSEGQNNFSSWVRDIIGDRRLADKLSELRTQEEMAKAVNIRVNYFKNRIH